MKFTDGVINRYGERMRCDMREIHGFISPIKPDDAQARKIPLPNGVKNAAEYRLITNSPVFEGMELEYRGRMYEVMRAEPVHAFQLISHYEAILHERGGAEHA